MSWVAAVQYNSRLLRDTAGSPHRGPWAALGLANAYKQELGPMPHALDFSILTAFAILWAAIVPTPGANSLMVTHVALTHGPRHVALAIAGNMAGILLLATAALLGMAIVLHTFPWLRLAIHLFGGAYLVYFGARLLDRARAKPASATPNGADAPAPAAWRTFALGFATALSNAQAIVFITSIFAVTGVLDASLATGVACIAAMIAMNASYLGLLGWLFLRPTPRRIYLRFRRWIEAGIGSLFVLFGVRLVYRELVVAARA